MNAGNLLAIFINNLPMVLSVLAALGMWKLGAALIRQAIRIAKEAAAKSKTGVDDALVAVVAVQLEEIAKLLDSGAISEAKRRVGIVQLQAKPIVGVKP